MQIALPLIANVPDEGTPREGTVQTGLAHGNGYALGFISSAG
jgi:hypothetical protein